MNPITLALGLEKKEPLEHHGLGLPDGWNNFRREGFNSCVDLVHSKLDVPKDEAIEKLANELYNIYGHLITRENSIVKWKYLDSKYKCIWLDEAQTIYERLGSVLIKKEKT